MKRLGLCLVVALLAVACGGSSTPDGGGADPTPSPSGPPVRAQGVWRLESGHSASGPIEPAPRAGITLEVDGDEVRGSAGCNTYGGTVVIDGSSFDAGGFAVTEIGCPGPLVEPETRYLEALEAVDTAARKGKTLTLTGPGTELVFRVVPPVDTEPLTGTVWILESLVEGPTLSSTVASAAPARLLLHDDKTFEGTTGCRLFSGNWSVSGDVVGVTQLVFEGDCERVPEQDAHVAAVLGTGFRAEVDGDRLTLTAEKGGFGLVYRAR
jgi:heat shock protein HslJ